MKKTIDIFILKTLAKKLGAFMIIVAVVIIVASYYAFQSSIVLVSSYNEQKQKAAQIVDLQNKIRNLNPNTVQTLQDSKEYVESFMPAKFDLLSTMIFIDVLSRRSGFKVGSLNVSEENIPKNAQKDKAVSLSADMSFDNFFEFLKDYKYSTSRVLNVGAINIRALKNQNIQLTSIIYAFDPLVDLENLHIENLNASDRKALESMKKHAATQKVTDSSISDSYSNRADPFR